MKAALAWRGRSNCKGGFVSKDHLGLFDTPPDRQEVRLGLAIAGLLFGGFLLILPIRDIRLREITAFVPMIDAIMFVCELIIATLLYAQASVFRSRGLTVLATGFVFAALLLVPHAFTFPGAFAPDGLLGAGVNTTAWIYTFRRATFPIAIILYVLLKRADLAAQAEVDRPAPRIAAGVISAIVLAVAVTMLATIGRDLLPPFFINHTDRIQSYAAAYHFSVFALCFVATVVLFQKRNSVLDMWLLVALSGWLIQSLLNVPIQARFTAGWYGLFVMMLVANLIVMLALIAESIRLYARLALSTAARNREREARLMSMDAVTAAISHEVGQPLTAVSLNASAGLSWLSRPRPDVKKAIMSLRAVSEAGQRTFDVVRSIRATFAKEPGQVTEFSLNDLVPETVALLDRELAASKIALLLALDDALPPIRADRVQMQRVLVNLITNAIESLRAISDRPRRIAIRSALIDGKDVLLQVSDAGSGIVPEDIDHIFDAFFTTKATGTGLGLPLCRTIVEDHGGRLWASRDEPYGATFHLRLPRSGAAAVAAEATDQLLTNLEGSLRWLRRTKSNEVTDVIAELQNIVDEVRDTMQTPKR
jgi:signal transduction histidine kinase